MPTPVFLTIDTEFAWRHHAAGLDAETIYQRSFEPAGVGVSRQLDLLAQAGLKACFFVDPMPALAFGLEPIARIVGTILDAGQEVQLHLHPNWARARAGDGGVGQAHCDMEHYALAEQRALIARATGLLVAAGAPEPVAFRAGGYAANDDTLAALAEAGFAYDSSHNGADMPRMGGIDLPASRIAPIRRGGLVEMPVTVIEDRRGHLRPFQLCALSSAEARSALDHAVARRHAAVTIVGHGFELANRAATRPNAVHVRRFEAVCAMLADRCDMLPTVHFADRPALRLDAHDTPLGPDRLRTARRHAEQLWSNWVEERA